VRTHATAHNRRALASVAVLCATLRLNLSLDPWTDLVDVA
jgi:hypothetical protein